MKGFRAKLNEFWNGTIEEAKQPTAKIVKSQYFVERPDITFEKLIRYHDETPQIQMSVASYSELITGTDILINADDQSAKEFIDEWNRRANFYDKFEGLVSTILICGNGILEKLDERETEDVMEVDMSTIISKKRNDVGELQYYEQRQGSGKIQKLDNLDKFIEFNLTHYSRQDWGRSLFYSLAVPRTTGYRTTPPLVEVLWGVEDAMSGIIQNNAYPITTITYPGANDEYLEKEAERWRRYKPGDKRVQKIKPEIEFFETSPASKYTDYITHLEKTIELGTQFPHDIMTGDFTSRASSDTTETIVMKRVRGYQRYLANKLKTELYDHILEQNGFDPQKANLSVAFVTEEIKNLTPQDVRDRVTAGLWTKMEGREWDRQNLGVELPDDKELEQPEKDTDQVNDLEKKVERLVSEHNLKQENEKMYERLERKIDLIKEAKEKDDRELYKKRIQALEKMMKKVDQIG